MFQKLLQQDSPFCIINKGDDVDVFVGDIKQFDLLDKIPRGSDEFNGDKQITSISMIPFCQIKERGYEVIDGGEKILTLIPNENSQLSKTEFLKMLEFSDFGLDGVDIELEGDVVPNISDEDFAVSVKKIIDEEIGLGEGCSFLMSRKYKGRIKNMDASKAFTLLKRLMENEFGSYMNFCFFDGEHFFIGASPERQISIFDGEVKMNPISGTLRKKYLNEDNFEKELYGFLQDKKEVFELFQVVDEELKMVSKICSKGGTITGPFLKEMRKVIHTEYLLEGKNTMDLIDAFRASMYPATMIGSPLENACRVVSKYESESRRYYSSALLILGNDENGREFLDSTITIRTVEIDADGNFVVQAGASIVRDSDPAKEAKESQAKVSGTIAALLGDSEDTPMLHMNDKIDGLLKSRNANLSEFWFSKQSKSNVIEGLKNKKAIIIDNEDEFTYMIAHMLMHLGLKVDVVSTMDYEKNGYDFVILGPGPGDPRNDADPKMRRLKEITKELLASGEKIIGVCLLSILAILKRP